MPPARPGGDVQRQGPGRHVPLLEVGEDAVLRRLARQAQQGDGRQRWPPAPHEEQVGELPPGEHLRATLQVGEGGVNNWSEGVACGRLRWTGVCM